MRGDSREWEGRVDIERERTARGKEATRACLPKAGLQAGLCHDHVEFGEAAAPPRRACGISESRCHPPRLGSSPAIQLLNAAAFFKNVFPLM